MLMQTVPEVRFGDEKVRLMKRVEFEKLASEGFFDDEKVELLFGMVVEMPPVDQAHGYATGSLHTDLARQLGDRANIYSASAFAASEISEPLPDVFVTAPGVQWEDRPTHALLIVEVSRSSLARDRGPKALLYGLADVDEYWIADQVHGVVEVHRDRRGDGSWGSKTTYGRCQTIALLAFPDVVIATDRLIPPPGV